MQSLQPRGNTLLSDPLRHQLNLYALAASAAGVTALALASPAEAKIVYTRSHLHIPQNSSVSLDLNHDGIKDFSFSDFYAKWTSNGTAAMLLRGFQGNEFWVKSNSAAALRPGVSVGSKAPLGGYAPMANMFQTLQSFHSWGPWVDAKDRYLGFKFSIKGKVHYGWARLSVSNGHGGFAAVVTGYAYETVPNKAIVTGKTKDPDVIPLQPGSLGRLALGSTAQQH